MKVLDNRLLEFAVDGTQGYGSRLHASYKHKHMKAISVRVTLASEILHEDRRSEERHVLRGAFYICGGAALAHKLMAVTRIRMYTLPNSGFAYMASNGCLDAGMYLHTANHQER